MELPINKIMNGDALEHLKELPEKSVNMVMTSPPYWALRDYGIKEQIGLEPTFDDYINNLCNIFDEVKRVLKDDGTIWVNLGDTYYGSGKGAGGDITKSKQTWSFKDKINKKCYNCGKEFEGYAFQNFCGSACSGVDNTPRNVKDAIEWKRKSRDEFNKIEIEKICLYCEKKFKGKPNSQFCSRDCLNKLGNDFRGQRRMLPDKCLTLIPERFAIEMVNRGWILRNKIIWHKPNAMPSSCKDRFTVDYEVIFLFSKKKKYYFKQQFEPVKQVSIERMGRKWAGSKHEKLGVENNMQQIIKAEEHMDKSRWLPDKGRNKRSVWDITLRGFSEAHFATYPEQLCETPIKAGCPKGGIVLDPFFGSGTTGVVALKQGKKFIGIELNPEYIEIAEKRLKPFLTQKVLNF